MAASVLCRCASAGSHEPGPEGRSGWRKISGGLFYRLNVFPIQIPALHERMDDIRSLVEYFVARYSKKAGKNIRKIEKKTLELFEAYKWPGNIRELQNLVERGVILCDGDTFSVDETWLTSEPPSRSRLRGLTPHDGCGRTRIKKGN